MNNNQLKSIEKDYIKANISTKTVSEIATEINRDEKFIEDYISELNKKSNKVIIKSTIKPKEKIKSNIGKTYIWQRISIAPYHLQRLDYFIALFVFLASFLLYIRTLTPSLSSGDNGELTTASYFLGVAHAPGYPLYVFMTKIFTYLPFGNVAWRANAFSAFCAAVSIFFVYMIFVKLIGQNRKTVKGFNPIIHIPAALTSLMFAFADNMWAQAVIAETYAMNILQVSILLFILLIWFEDVWNKAHEEHSYFGTRYLMAFGFIYGTAFGNQHIILPFGIAPLLFVLLVLILVNKHRYIEYLETSFISIVIFSIFIIVGGFAYLRFIMNFQSNLFFHYSIARDTNFFEIIFKPLMNPDLFMDIIKALGDKSYLIDHAKISSLSDPIYPNLYKGMFVIFWPSFFMLVWFFIYKYILQKTDRFGKDHDYISGITTVYYQMLFAFLLGALVYVYMPIRARALPPLNWGQLNEPSGWENLSYFFNMLHRKQYGNAGADVPPDFLLHFEQVLALIRIYKTQLTLVVLLFLIPGIIQIIRKNKPMAIFSTVCFFMYTVPLTIYVNPPANDRSMAIFDVFFLPGTLYYTMILLFGVQWYIEYANKNIKKFISNENVISTEGIWYKRISKSQYISIAVVIAIMAYPFMTNFKRNDESNNWSNHDYSFNMMNTLPPNAILATEGGDNQVFGLAYYTMVERRRPDIKVYDQKGNVFERIYGNLMKVNFSWINDISDEIDKTFIESGRPYYTTWKRDRLSDMGDYYFKKYGLLYKVQPIRYSLIDKLYLLNQMTVSEYQTLASALLNSVYSYEKISIDINSLIDENLIRVDNKKESYLPSDNIYFVSMYPLPYPNLKTDEDYWDMYTVRGQMEERKYWDYLTREIFINYASTKIESYDIVINNYKIILSKTTEESEKQQILNDIDLLEQKKEEEYSNMLYLGSDMPYVFYRVAAKESSKGNYENSIKYFNDMLVSDPHAFQAHINIALAYESIARSDDTPEQDEKIYLNKAIDELNEAKKIFFRGKNVTERSLQNNGSYQQILYMISRLETQKQLTRSHANVLREQAKIEKTAESYVAYSQILMQRFDLEKAEEVLIEAKRIGSSDEKVIKIIDMQLANIYANTQRYDLSKRIYESYSNDMSIEGAISLTMLAQMYEGQEKLNEALELYVMFLTKFQSLATNQEIAEYYNFASSRASSIDNYLSQFRGN